MVSMAPSKGKPLSLVSRVDEMFFGGVSLYSRHSCRVRRTVDKEWFAADHSSISFKLPVFFQIVYYASQVAVRKHSVSPSPLPIFNVAKLLIPLYDAVYS